MVGWWWGGVVDTNHFDANQDLVPFRCRFGSGSCSIFLPSIEVFLEVKLESEKIF
jgi:hypothetical protein